MTAALPSDKDRRPLARRQALPGTRLPRWRKEDREFLPAALELVETPPSPVQLWLLYAICAFVAIAIVWMFIGRIDVIAVAPGKVQPSGRVKLVQALEMGKVREVMVGNGTHVQEGAVVVALDDREARAEEQALAEALASYRAEARRRRAAIEAAQADGMTPPDIDWSDDVPAPIIAREQRVLAGDLGQLRSALASFAAQRRQKEAERARLATMIASQEALTDIEDQRTRLRSLLEGQKLGSKLVLLDALEARQNQRTVLAQQKGQLAEAMAALDVLERDATKTISSFVAENTQKLADAERQAADTVQKLAKARARTAHMTLTAPASGTVQALTITSIGQVLMPGEEIMRIVPENAGFVVECYMPNKDIGFVAVGQEAIVKVEAFPFTRYGSLPARVARVSLEAIPEPDAQQQEANPARASRSTLTAGAQHMQNLVFPVTLTLQNTSIHADGLDVPVANGMAVTVEVVTGRRRVIDYLFSPLVEVASRALTER